MEIIAHSAFMIFLHKCHSAKISYLVHFQCTILAHWVSEFNSTIPWLKCYTKASKPATWLISPLVTPIVSWFESQPLVNTPKHFTLNNIKLFGQMKLSHQHLRLTQLPLKHVRTLHGIPTTRLWGVDMLQSAWVHISVIDEQSSDSWVKHINDSNKQKF